MPFSTTKNGTLKADKNGNIKYLGNVIDNYQVFYLDRTALLVFSDEIVIDTNLIHNTFVNLIIGYKESEKLRITDFYNHDIFEVDKKIEYFKTLIK